MFARRYVPHGAAFGDRRPQRHAQEMRSEAKLEPTDLESYVALQGVARGSQTARHNGVLEIVTLPSEFHGTLFLEAEPERWRAKARSGRRVQSR